MQSPIRSLLIYLGLSLSLLTSPSLFAAEDTRYIHVGSGSVINLYFPTGGFLCSGLNEKFATHHLRCTVELTAGGIENLEKVAEGKLQFGFTEADWQTQAYEKYKNLRSVFSIFDEVFTVVVRADANVKTLDDLKGKRINIGEAGSGQRASMENLMQAFGWDNTMFQAFAIRDVDQADALCHNQIDAFVYMTGHPSVSVRQAIDTGRQRELSEKYCDEATILNVSGNAVEQFIAKQKDYHTAIIAGNTYERHPNDISSFSTKATLVTSTDVPDDIVYEVVKTVFSSFAEGKKLHPVFANLTPAKMMLGNTAPLHAGAAKYYREQGWIK
ncbi:TAXI family TRAP transporter solute-binding subunit [Beggiatoa leptomitoformis]|uniref:TAXI family TRAP transporter solute-binding subunit n=1 Tax=Beggiatoa leptomitoformis TaxID=288004 RepID=A0A2N9YJI0_9GAMM|nr:TAXI family TRAP transporter solute-binding subunit [Beggiatoa leptomitoformis]ALG69382.2 TAXI family TRAP transporter solute-binding subunit [Beggiatoa leptomitoformis]AUI70687.2 TAXI family TRAP transporter solute-binding subunit [Beggiatoa leptomitoformis]